MIEQSFDNIKYGSCPQNADYEKLPIEYKQKLFIKKAIDCLTNNSVEMLKVNYIKWSLDNRIY